MKGWNIRLVDVPKQVRPPVFERFINYKMISIFVKIKKSTFKMEK